MNLRNEWKNTRPSKVRSRARGLFITRFLDKPYLSVRKLVSIGTPRSSDGNYQLLRALICAEIEKLNKDVKDFDENLEEDIKSTTPKIRHQLNADESGLNITGKF